MSARFSDRLVFYLTLLNNSEREELASHAKSIDLKPIEIFLDFHQNLSGFIFVVSGSIELITNAEQGQFALVNTLQDRAIHPCDIFNDKEDNPYRIRANQDGVIIQYLDKDNIRAFKRNQLLKKKF